RDKLVTGVQTCALPISPLHLAMEMFKHAAGIDLVHVPYRGDAPLLTALIAGDIQVAFVPQSTGLQHINNGVARALAVTGTKRSEIGRASCRERGEMAGG